MIITNNPFTSKTYNQEWSKNFNEGKPHYEFNFIQNIGFTKHKTLPLYINIGKFKTLGISYKITPNSQSKDYKGKVFLIYDVPQYFEVDTEISNTCKLALLKTMQYDGYLVDLRQFSKIEDYLSSQFKSKDRNNIFRRLKKLEQKGNLSYHVHYGDISDVEFNEVFEELYQMITNQFETRKDTNSHQFPEIKNWYKSLFLKLIREKKGSFFRIKMNGQTITSMFSYNSDSIYFAAIPTIDLSFAKYGIGNIRTLKSIQWAIENSFEYYDLAKGSYGYKHKWATKKYKYQHHILYDKGSVKAFCIATALHLFFELKQLARTFWHRIRSK